MILRAVWEDQLWEINRRSILGRRGRNSAGDEALRSASGVSRQEPWLSEPCYAQRGSHYGVAGGSAGCMTIFKLNKKERGLRL